MTTTGSDIVAGMDVQGENTERICQVKDVGATGVVVRVQRDLYVPFTAICTCPSPRSTRSRRGRSS